jgi:hypothetical protein
MPSTSSYARARVTPHRRAFLSLLCLSACGGPVKVAATGLAYPEVSAQHGAPTPIAGPAAPGAATAARVPGATLAPVVPSTPSFGAAPFAGEGPTLLEQVSSDGGWVALCQTRKEAAHRYLIAPGEELAIDAFSSASPDGRFALFTRSGVLTLWDSQTRKTVDLSALGADSRSSAESYATLRALDFDAKSERLLYVRQSAKGARIVLRNLSDGAERELDPGPGEVWRARFDPGGAFVVLQMITTDSNKNGKFDFPAPLLAAPRACGDNLSHFRAWEGRGDRPETVLLPLSGEAPMHEPELVMPVRDALLLRDENGALFLQRGDKKRLLEPADCKGRVVHADGARELFIVGCTQKKKTGRVSLELVTREARKPLDIELASVELDREASDSPRLVALYPGSDSLLFDADRHELIALQPGDGVLAVRQARALVRRGKALLIYDADLRKELPLPATVDKYPNILTTPPFVFVTPVLINLDAAQVVGTSKQRPLALSATGQILVAEADPDGSTWARGPLRWLALTPSLPSPAPPSPLSAPDAPSPLAAP